ncbi:MAG: Rrf2 family transcriptional regulator [Myxococcota bacterium]
MKLTAQEEYGLRCLMTVAQQAPDPQGPPVSIKDVARREGLSVDYAGKLMRVLRQAELISSARGANGGYRLARPADEIALRDVLTRLDAPLFGGHHFCQNHTGQLESCIHDRACSLRGLWSAIDQAVADVLGGMTLADLLIDRPIEEEA